MPSISEALATRPGAAWLSGMGSRVLGRIRDGMLTWRCLRSVSCETTSGLMTGGRVAAESESLLERASALGTDAGHGEPLGRPGGDDSGHAPEPFEERAGRGRRDARDGGEHRLRRFVPRLRSRSLRVCRSVRCGLDLLAANCQPVNPES